MIFDDGDIPDWALPLVRGPIKVERMTEVELEREFRERLDALLRLYGFDTTPEGWRSLALRLALDHEIVPGQPVMQVITPVDRQAGVGGAEPGRRWWLAMRTRKRAEKLGSRKAAAKEVAKTSDLSAGRLQNLVTDLDAGRVAKPREMQRQPWDEWIKAVLRAAADRLENNHDSTRLLS